MRAFRFPLLAILSILVGYSTLVCAQDEKPEPDKPRQEERNAQPKQDEARPPHQDEAKPPKPEKQEGKQQQRQEQRESQGQVNSHEQPRPERSAENGRPAGKGGHIPDDKFRAHFGRSHSFAAKTVIVSGQPQFQYSGYTFELVDAWPQDWAYTDDCYIDYIDGEYFLFDLLHPGLRIAVIVLM